MIVPQSLAFWKYQGCGNDVLIFEHAGPFSPDQVRLLCDRRLGIGADQILVLSPDLTLDPISVQVYNADGSHGQVCGNGLRCATVHVFSRIARETCTFMVCGVPCAARYYKSDAANGIAGVALALPTFVPAQIPANLPEQLNRPGSLLRSVAYPNPELRDLLRANGCDGTLFAVGVGNPHAVFITSHASAAACVSLLGPLIENDITTFPQRTNVHWCTIQDKHNITMLTWERGAGHTPSCGSGAYASALALERANLVTLPVDVHMPGGKVRIERCPTTGNPLLRGPAELVFEGKVAVSLAS